MVVCSSYLAAKKEIVVKRLLQRMWQEDSGTLSFEWVTLTTLLTIGAVGGLASVRDAVVDEMADMTEAIVSLDQTYVIQPPCTVSVHRANGRAKVREFRSTGPGIGVQVRPHLYGGNGGGGSESGAAGSMYLDTRPKIERESEGAPMDQPEPSLSEGDL